MLNTTLRRLGLRGRPSRSRTVPTRRSARPALELLEARDVPSAPYTPYGTPQIVASLPQQQIDHSQSLTFALANNARGDSITASVNLPQPKDMVLEGDGLWYASLDRYGNLAPRVFVEGLDYNPYDDGYTSDLTGEVAVAVAPDPPYAPVAPFSPFAIAYVRDEAHFPDPNGPADWAKETLYVRSFDAYGVQLGGPVAVAQVDLINLPPRTNYFIHDVKIGADRYGGYTVAWLNDTQVASSYTEHGSQTIDLDVARVGGTPTLVAHSFLDTGTSGTPPSQWVGDMVRFPDLATNPSGQSEVVWARLVKPPTYFSSAYLTTEHIYGQSVDGTAALVGPRMTLSQLADTYEPSPVPKVAMNDSGKFVVSYCYAPPYNPYMQLLTDPGIYAVQGIWAGQVGNEFMVVSNPNSTGEPPLPPPYSVQYYVGHWNHPVGIDAAGNFVVGWYNSTSDGSRTKLWVKAYWASGAPRPDPFTVAVTTNPWPNSVGLDTFQLAMDAAGNFTAAYANPNDVPGLWRSVLAQRFVQDGFAGPGGAAPRSTVEFLT